MRRAPSVAPSVLVGKARRGVVGLGLGLGLGLGVGLALGACAGDAGAGPDAGVVVDPPGPADVRALAAAVAPEPGPPTIDCAALPPDGPCSLACDHDALLARYVPAGTCAQFRCDIGDDIVRIGGCRPAE